MAPQTAGNIKTIIGAIQIEQLLAGAVVNHYVKAAGEGDNEFPLFFESMAATYLSTGHIVYPICARYVEGDAGGAALYKRKVAACIGYARNLDKVWRLGAVFYGHRCAVGR